MYLYKKILIALFFLLVQGCGSSVPSLFGLGKSPLPPFHQAPFAIQSQYQDSLPATILSLLGEAKLNRDNGDIIFSIATVERALRIVPRNPVLTYILAALRLQQGTISLAQNLAKKTILLADKDKLLIKQSWLLIAIARKQQGDHAGARQAQLKAQSI